MKFSTTLIATFAALALAAPTSLQKRAGVLGTKTYDEISISGGIAGDAEAEALAVFSALDLNDMAAVNAADVDFLGAVNNIANDTEVGAFNPAIDTASKDEKTAFTNGKIKNKVLNLMATKLELQI